MKNSNPKNLFRINSGAIHETLEDAIKDSVWDAAEDIRNLITDDVSRTNIEDAGVLMENEKEILSALNNLRNAYAGKHVTEYHLSK